MDSSRLSAERAGMLASLKLVVMGTGPFAVPTFRALLSSDSPPQALVTRPVPPARRRSKQPANPMRDVGLEHGLMILDPEDVNSDQSRKQLEALQPDLLVVCDYGQILSKETLSVARLGGINLHGSLLPKYRGAAPINWAVYHGETTTGVTVIHMSPRLDAGPCLAECETAIGRDETAVELEARLSQLGVEPVLQAMELLVNWDGQANLGRSQDPEKATRARRLRKSDGRIDWRQSAEQIRNQIRAFQPWPGSYTHWLKSERDPLRVILLAAELVDNDHGTERPGTVVQVSSDRMVVRAGKGALQIMRLQPAGKRPMDTGQWLRGYPVQVGDVLGEPDGDPLA